MFKFIKNTLTGVVHIAATNAPARDIYLQPNCDLVPNADYKSFAIIAQSGQKHTFNYADIESYKIDSGASVSTAGLPLRDFLAVLAQSFFFKVVAGQLNASIVRTGETTVNIAASSNNLVIPNIANISIIRLNAAVPLVVTGFVAPSPAKQQEFLILNVGAQVQLTRESLLSSAPNRIAGVNATETLVATNGSRCAIYDTTINRFKILQ